MHDFRGGIDGKKSKILPPADEKLQQTVEMPLIKW